ncbi:MAG: hypothetical protein AVO33_08515 [delta proteobacterium ML8_F1]|nr:MAG: hypothetical protein AVO33_08515 [delta proteobacterium ML8_F1]
MKEKLIMIDGNSLVNRAFFALPRLTNSEGVFTNGILGFSKMLLRAIHDFSPDYVVVAFDVKAPTFRHDYYEDYKGTRKGMPEELAMQMPLLKEMLDALGISRVELPGFEADDLLGTMAVRATAMGIESVIISGDKDTLQLVDGKVSVALTKKGISEIQLYDREKVHEDLGVYPEQVVDLKALAGDTSDNIPGVRGVGQKTARTLIETFGTIENIYEQLESVTPDRVRGLLAAEQDKAFISKKLAAIVTAIPAEFSIEDYAFKGFDARGAQDILGRLELNSLLKDFGVTQSAGQKDISRQFEIVTAFDTESLKSQILEEKAMTFKLLADKTGPLDYEIHWMGIALGGRVFITREVMEFKEIFEDQGISKKGFMLKEDYLMLRVAGIKLAGIQEDLLISHYLLYPDRTSTDLEKLGLQLMNYEIKSLDTLTGKGKIPVRDLPEAAVKEYLKDLLLLAEATREDLGLKIDDKGLRPLYQTVEIPLVEVLGEMEYQGIKVDFKVLDAMDELVGRRTAELEALIYSYAMEPFNINSPKQLGEILFNKLGLRTLKKTKTGHSTSHDVLVKLVEDHPIVPLIMEYRSYTKLKNTYIDGLRAVADKETMRIHTSFNQTIAVTGRLSSTEPNLQNIPIRLDLGRELRKVFVASSKEHRLVGADYSQIELRILAHLSQDPQLLRAYQEGIDIHTLTASQVFDIPIEAVTSKERGEAKGVNFGIVYGISDYGLSENLNIPRQKAKIYIEQYFEKYQKVKEYLDQLIEGCRRTGEVETILGRKRGIPDINASNFTRRSFAERTAMNTPIQGSAADIIKVAMIRVYNKLKEEGLKAKLILQVHDELIIDTPLEEVEKVKALLEEAMSRAMTLTVPLDVEVRSGENWYETK